MSRRGLWIETGLNLALLTVAVSVLDAGVFFLVTRGALTDASAGLAADASAVVAAQLGATDRAGWAAVVDGHRAREATVYGPSGEVIAGVDRPASAAVRSVVATREVTSRVAEGVVEAAAPVGPGRPSAVIAVRVPMTAMAKPAWTVLGVHAAVSAAMIVAFGLIPFRGSVLLPVERLREATRRIARGERADVSEDAPAELAELARALNTTSEALADYRTRTAEQLARLEAANAEIQRAQEALVRSEKLASVGRLAAGLAHELGNPLTAVRGYLEIMALEGNDSEVLRRSRIEAERMHHLLRNLLDFARHESREIADVDVAELLEEATRTVRHQQHFRGVTVTTRTEPGLTLRGETPKLHQVLVNLLLNASDAGAKTVALEGERSDAGVVIRCRDDGSGIATEHLEKLFEPFFTTRASGHGTGLGLAIAHKVVEQHNGRIEVVSEPGRTEFVLTFGR